MLTYDYDKFDKRGLAKLIKHFEKEALPVAEIKGDNKPKRETGFQVKTALILFESGQKLEIKAKVDGGIFSWKLNTKMLAIKNYMQLDTAMKEVIGYVKENEPNYQKQREKQLAKVKVAIPTIKPVNTTVAEQTAAYQTNFEELDGQNEALNSQIVEVSTQADGKRVELDALTIQIANANTLTLQLEMKLGNAKQGIFESVGNSSALCPECGTAMDACKVEKNADGEMTDCYRCPKCGAETDGDCAILESGDAVAATCRECGATMQECEGGMKCPECGCKTDADGMVMESGCKKKDEEGGE